MRYRLPRPDGTLVDRPAIVVAIDEGGRLSLNVQTDGGNDGYPSTPVLYRSRVPFSATPRAHTWHWPPGYVPFADREAEQA